MQKYIAAESEKLLSRGAILHTADGPVSGGVSRGCATPLNRAGAFNGLGPCQKSSCVEVASETSL